MSYYSKLAYILPASASLSATTGLDELIVKMNVSLLMPGTCLCFYHFKVADCCYLATDIGNTLIDMVDHFMLINPGVRPICAATKPAQRWKKAG
jgi:hypothetical protein